MRCHVVQQENFEFYQSCQSTVIFYDFLNEPAHRPKLGMTPLILPRVIQFFDQPHGVHTPGNLLTGRSAFSDCDCLDRFQDARVEQSETLRERERKNAEIVARK